MRLHDGESTITVRVNRQQQTLVVEPRVTLVDALRDRLGLTGTKRAATAVSAGRALCT